MTNERIESFKLEKPLHQEAIDILLLSLDEGLMLEAAKRRMVAEWVARRWVLDLERYLKAILYSAESGSAKDFALTPAGMWLFEVLRASGELSPEYVEKVLEKYPRRELVMIRK